MGLIQEVRDVGYSLNKQERARREKQQQKILLENYKKELKEYLTAEISAVYRQNDFETAKNIVITEKDSIIKYLYNELYNRHYLKKSNEVQLVFLKSPPWDKRWKFEREKEKVYIFRDFDIISDLDNLYYKIADKIEKEENRTQRIKNKILFDQLKKSICNYMNLDLNKYFIILSLQQNENIKAIIENITKNENEKELLYNNYDKILKQVIKLYNGDITKGKMEIKAQKEKAKMENRQKTIKWLLCNFIITKINKSIPKGHNLKKKY